MEGKLMHKKTQELNLKAIAPFRIGALRGQRTFRQNSANNTRTTRRRAVLGAKPEGTDNGLLTALEDAVGTHF